MIIDCATCPVQGTGCADCVVTTLLALPTLPALPAAAPTGGISSFSGADELIAGAGLPAEGAWLDPEEQRALSVLVAAGLVPPMRLRSVTLGDHPTSDRVGVTDDTPSARRRAI